jgi:hypothetical protein
MPKGMQPIYTKLFDSNTNGFVFNNIPQAYTDLLIKLSTKGTSSSMDSFGIYLNESQAAISNTSLIGNGSSASSGRSTYRAVGNMAGNDYTANTFNNYEIYIPNYTSNSFKQILIDGSVENNGSACLISMVSCLFRINSPVKTFRYDSATAGLAQLPQTTISLYGIGR